MITIERRSGKLNPKKTIFSDLEPNVDVVSAKLLKKGSLFYVDKYEIAFAFLEGEKMFLERGVFTVKSDMVGILWLYSERIPVKIGVPKSSTPFEVGGYATIVAAVINPNAFSEFILRKGMVSINKLREKAVIKINAQEVLREDLFSLVRRALFKVVEEDRINRDYFRDVILELFEKDREHYEVLQYFTIDVSEAGFSTFCKSIDEKISEILDKV